MPDVRCLQGLDKMSMLFLLLHHADAARPSMMFVGMEEEWKYTEAVHAGSGGRHWFPCNVMCGCGSSPDENAVYFRDISEQVDGASFLDGAHFYNNAQHSQEHATSAGSKHKQGVFAANKEKATRWSGSFLENARLYSHLSGGQLQSRSMRKARLTIGWFMWRIWYILFYGALIFLSIFVVGLCLDKNCKDYGPCALCCAGCGVCVLVCVGMFIFSGLMLFGRYVSGKCECDCT
ncbi:unnamed protein product [Symbiodinium natans]|uniref:Uncharacterized protein n=1 Tax=Symbiodinium natans TaxID=878477 RepID=A0A812QQE2_9DINO|nr:unnamed protein product [Symbiodinium natans]